MSTAREKLDKLIEEVEKDVVRCDKAVATLAAKGTSPSKLMEKVMEQATLWDRRRTLYGVKGALGDIV